MSRRYSMIGRTLLAVFFVIAGVLHFLIPQAYCRIMPPLLPAPYMLVKIAGAAEILGGIGLIVPSTRQAAAWGLVVFLIAVLPANIYMATAHIRFPGIMGQSWAQWARVPLQLPMIYWAWLYTKSR
jgi:uncharacterized membrane protein